MLQFWSRDDLKKVLGSNALFWKEDCPFCKDINNSERVIWKWLHWAIIYNKYPYILGWKHIMLIPIEHICFSKDISPEIYNEYWEAQKFISLYFNGEQYFSFTRESIEERSVEHLHIHFITGKLKRAALTEMLKLQWYESME